MERKRDSRRDNRKKVRESDAGRRRSRYLEGVASVDFRDYELLRKLLTPHGKIMPARFTGASPKQQRQIARAIRRARVMGLLP